MGGWPAAVEQMGEKRGAMHTTLRHQRDVREAVANQRQMAGLYISLKFTVTLIQTHPPPQPPPQSRAAVGLLGCLLCSAGPGTQGFGRHPGHTTVLPHCAHLQQRKKESAGNSSVRHAFFQSSQSRERCIFTSLLCREDRHQGLFKHTHLQAQRLESLHQQSRAEMGVSCTLLHSLSTALHLHACKVHPLLEHLQSWEVSCCEVRGTANKQHRSDASAHVFQGASSPRHAPASGSETPSCRQARCCPLSPTALGPSRARAR